MRRRPSRLVLAGVLALTGWARCAIAEEVATQKTEPSPLVEGSWTVVVVPDTQNYVKRGGGHEVLNNMMDWMAANRDKRNIRMVVNVGDMVNNNPDTGQWERVRASYGRLDNVLTYVVCVGNHDGRPPKNPSRINDYFKIGDNPLNEAIFRGSYEGGKLQNAYYVLEQNNQKYLFIALEYSTRRKVIDWADRVIKSHPDHHVFITVHVYMSEAARLVSEDGLPGPNKECPTGHDKVGIHRHLAGPNPNVEFVVCGHVGAVRPGAKGKGPGRCYAGKLVYDKDIATGHRSDTRTNGPTLHQMLFNAQWIPNGGDGWMLLLEFQPGNKKVHVKTFSPYRGLWRTGPEYEYILDRRPLEKPRPAGRRAAGNE